MGKFEIIQTTLDIDAMPYKSYRYTFEFTENDNKIILTSQYGGGQTILTRLI